MDQILHNGNISLKTNDEGTRGPLSPALKFKIIKIMGGPLITTNKK